MIRLKQVKRWSEHCVAARWLSVINEKKKTSSAVPSVWWTDSLGSPDHQCAVFGDGDSLEGLKVKWGHRGGLSCDKISVLTRKYHRDLVLSFPELMLRKGHDKNAANKRGFTINWISRNLDLGLAVSRNVRNKCLLLKQTHRLWEKKEISLFKMEGNLQRVLEYWCWNTSFSGF